MPEIPAEAPGQPVQVVSLPGCCPALLCRSPLWACASTGSQGTGLDPETLALPKLGS